MDSNQIHVVLYTVPQAACDSNKMSWYDVAGLVKKQVAAAFGEDVSFTHIEFMTQRWFDSIQAQVLLEKGEVNFPFVTVNDELACADKKVNLSRIKQIIRTKLQS